MNRRIATAMTIAAALLAPAAARAATEQGTVNVSATVGAICVVGDATLAFGAYDPIAGNVATSLDAQVNVTISCTGGTAWTLGLGTGANVSGTQRRMRSGASSYLNYGLYKDTARSQPWGDSVVSERASGTQATTGSTTVVIYGRVPNGQLPPAGTYTDTVTATIYF